MENSYEAPTVTELGSIVSLTQGTVHGSVLDASIPAGTPVSQIPGFVSNHLTS
jgi:hypothetical protein